METIQSKRTEKQFLQRKNQEKNQEKKLNKWKNKYVTLIGVLEKARDNHIVKYYRRDTQLASKLGLINITNANFKNKTVKASLTSCGQEFMKQSPEYKNYKRITIKNVLTYMLILIIICSAIGILAPNYTPTNVFLELILYIARLLSLGGVVFLIVGFLNLCWNQNIITSRDNRDIPSKEIFKFMIRHVNSNKYQHIKQLLQQYNDKKLWES